jgi:sec-independent protein translocase protein TatC
MLILAIPMLVLFIMAEIIARSLDRARGRGSEAEVGDDELSPL